MEWITFQRFEVMGFSTYITRYSTGETYRLGKKGYMSWGPSWDRSGERLIYHSMKFSGPLVLYDVKTGISQTILEGFYPVGRQWASWSPDGRQFAFNWITYTALGKADTALYVVSTADRQVRRVASVSLQNEYFKRQSPDWMPDQDHLVGIGERAGHSELVSIDLSGNHRETLTASKTRKSEVAASPDGEIVAFIAAQDKEEDIWLFDLAREEELQLTFSGGDEAHISFSPDGANIAFSGKQEDEDKWGLFVVSADLGTEKQYSRENFDYTNSSWLDADRLYCEVKTDSSRHAEIFTLSEDRSAILYSTGDNKFNCTHPTGNLASLYYVENQWIGSNIQKVDLSKGLVSTFINDNVARPIFSPNDSLVVYVRMDSSWPTSSIWVEDVRHIIQAANFP